MSWSTLHPCIILSESQNPAGTRPKIDSPCSIIIHPVVILRFIVRMMKNYLKNEANVPHSRMCVEEFFTKEFHVLNDILKCDVENYFSG